MAREGFCSSIMNGDMRIESNWLNIQRFEVGFWRMSCGRLRFSGRVDLSTFQRREARMRNMCNLRIWCNAICTQMQLNQVHGKKWYMSNRALVMRHVRPPEPAEQLQERVALTVRTLHRCENKVGHSNDAVSCSGSHI